MAWVTGDSVGIFRLPKLPRHGKRAAIAMNTMPKVTADSTGIFRYDSGHGKVAEMTGVWEQRDSSGKQLLTQVYCGKAVVKHWCENLAAGSKMLARVHTVQESSWESLAEASLGDPVCVPSKPMPAILSKKAKTAAQLYFFGLLSSPTLPMRHGAPIVAMVPIHVNNLPPADSPVKRWCLWVFRGYTYVILQKCSKGKSLVKAQGKKNAIMIQYGHGVAVEGYRYWKPKVGPVTGVMLKMQYCKVISCLSGGANMVSGLATITAAALVSSQDRGKLLVSAKMAKSSLGAKTWVLWPSMDAKGSAGISHFEGSMSKIGKNVSNSALLRRPDRYHAGLGMPLSRLKRLPAAALWVQHIGNLLKGKYCKWCKMRYCQHNKDFLVTKHWPDDFQQ
ncbi:hypothetical protein BDR04DRAFT_1114121 [Suillus decipiens]|nr:hypothetical protein BDR04DRAFT_1114121 [Suillus decipiens]